MGLQGRNPRCDDFIPTGRLMAVKRPPMMKPLPPLFGNVRVEPPKSPQMRWEMGWSEGSLLGRKGHAPEWVLLHPYPQAALGI